MRRRVQRRPYSEGDRVPSAPTTEPIWVAWASGSGEQTLDWTIEPGEWAVVIMNADGSTGVSTDVSFGALAPAGLTVLAWSVFGAGLAALAGGGWLIYLANRRWRVTTSPAAIQDGADETTATAS